MNGLLGRLRRLPWFTLVALGVLLCLWVIIPNGALDRLAASGQPVAFLVTVRSRTPEAAAWLFPGILLTAGLLFRLGWMFQAARFRDRSLLRAILVSLAL